MFTKGYKFIYSTLSGNLIKNEVIKKSICILENPILIIYNEMYFNVVSAFEFSNMLSQLLFLETLP